MSTRLLATPPPGVLTERLQFASGFGKIPVARGICGTGFFAACLFLLRIVLAPELIRQWRQPCGGLVFRQSFLQRSLARFLDRSLPECSRQACPSQAPDPIVDQAKQLVHDALRAEADDNADLRAADLKQAITLAADLPEAHWQSGEVRRGNHWLTTSDVERETTSKAKMAEYRKLQDQAAVTVDDQLKIARWCDKNGLDEEEKAHARVALQADPNQEEAMRRLGLVKYRGQIIPKSQFDETKAEYQQALADSKEWRTRLWKLRRQYERDPASRNDTLSQIRSITDIRAIPAIEAVFATADPEPAIAAVEALSAMESLKATQSLIRFAVLADPNTVRYAAATALKRRDIYSTVPTLLAQMQGPIQAAYLNLGMEGNTAVSRFAFLQENADTYRLDLNYEHVNYTGVDASHGAGHGFTLPATEEPRMKARIDAANRANAQLNRRITLVLATVTDQKLDDDPKSWWNWWYGQNEFYEPDEKPIDWYSSDYTTTESAAIDVHTGSRTLAVPGYAATTNRAFMLCCGDAGLDDDRHHADRKDSRGRISARPKL